MYDTAYRKCAHVDPEFHLNKTDMGLILYSVFHCPDCEKSETLNRGCSSHGAVLECFHNVNSDDRHVSNKKLFLKDTHGRNPTNADLNVAMSYFGLSMKKLNENKTPEDQDFANFMECLKDIDFSTTKDIDKFAKEHWYDIPSGLPYGRAMHLLALHYQTHCNLRIAAWEGGHRQLLSVFAIENLPWSASIPFHPGHVKECLPTISPLHETCLVNLYQCYFDKKTTVAPYCCRTPT